MSEHHIPQLIERKFFTPGTIVLMVFMAIGFTFLALRFFFGLGFITNLDDSWPWGIWITIDVASGVALAAGGFTTGALVHIFWREHYHAIVRPALLTAMLGYTFVGVGVMIDLGRFYNIWHPMLPSMWSGNSALFEVGMCVMVYLTVLYIEFLPIFVEGLKGRIKLPGPLAGLNAPIESLLGFLETSLDKVMFIFIIAGVVLSCMHQSSLGTLMVIAKYKMHALWYTPIMPFLFLLSAIMVGFPMVIFESIIASKSFRLKPEMDIIGPLARVTAIIGTLYAAVKILDLLIRDAFGLLFTGSFESLMFWIELGVCVILPVAIFYSSRARKSPALLMTGASLIVAGIVINRINVFLVAFNPLYSTKSYFPAIGEIAVTVAMICTIMFLYRIIVTFFPVISQPRSKQKA